MRPLSMHDPGLLVRLLVPLMAVVVLLAPLMAVGVLLVPLMAVVVLLVPLMASVLSLFYLVVTGSCCSEDGQESHCSGN